MPKELVLIYEYIELTLKQLFDKMNKLRNNEYKLVSVGSKFVKCEYTPRKQNLNLSRSQLEWRIDCDLEIIKNKTK